MKIITKLLIIGLIFLIGCFSIKSSQQKNQIEMSPFEANPITPPTTETSVSKETEFINSDGWMIPMPKKRKQIGKGVKKLQTEAKKEVKVTLFTYVPEEPFFFNCCETDKDSKKTPFNLKMKLVTITESRVGKSIFAYLISVKECECGISIYRIIDKDGDGKFETLLTNNPYNSVPDWVVK